MKLVKFLVGSASFLASSTAAFAIDSPVSTNFSNVGGIFNAIFLFLIGIVGGLAIIFIVIGGIRYILARGDQKSTESARATITAALIGLVVALLAVVIVLIVGQLLGTCGVNLPGTPPRPC